MKAKKRMYGMSAAPARKGAKVRSTGKKRASTTYGATCVGKGNRGEHAAGAALQD